MNKLNFKSILFSTFALILISVNFLIDLSVQASSDHTLYVVKATAGLNYRDQNCKVKGTFPYQAVLTHYQTESANPKSIACNVNGTNYQMLRISNNGTDYYVAGNYLQAVIGKLNEPAPTTKYQVNASIGLNFRDINCKKIGAFPNKTVLTQGNSTNTNSPVVCKVKDEYYSMWSVNYQGKNGFVASYYLNIL